VHTHTYTATVYHKRTSMAQRRGRHHNLRLNRCFPSVLLFHLLRTRTYVRIFLPSCNKHHQRTSPGKSRTDQVLSSTTKPDPCRNK